MCEPFSYLLDRSDANDKQILFYGIVVFMNYNDHDPPHFHARYQDQEVIVEIQSGLVQGKMSRRPLRMVIESAEQNSQELTRNWELARG